MYPQYFHFTIGKSAADVLFKEILVDVLEYHPTDALRWLEHFNKNKCADLRPLPDKYGYVERMAVACPVLAQHVMRYALWYHISAEGNIIKIGMDDNNFASNLSDLLKDEHADADPGQIAAAKGCIERVIREIAVDTEKVINKYGITYLRNSLHSKEK